MHDVWLGSVGENLFVSNKVPDGEIGEDRKAGILSRTALGRRGDPSDIASAVAYLGLDATFVTGQVINVDGGRSLSM